jgi:hypothetical protein
MTTALRIAAGALRRRPSELPERPVERARVQIDRRHLAAYDRVCGFRLRDTLPATYPHVLVFPLALELMTATDFPFGVLGLVHVANRIEVVRPVDAGERLDLSVRAGGLRPHDRGTQFDLIGEASVGGELVWCDRSTYLHRSGSGSRGSRSSCDPPVASAVWRVPGDIGRRYARVSGDSNPIHLHPLPAKLFGQPGAIAHGMWTKARCLAALEASLPASYAVDVRFKLPLPIPAKVGFSFDGERFSVHGVGTGKPHLEGRLE